jgi:hypothetical protein
MTPSVIPLEEVSRVAPAGVRFWDVAAGQIANGLLVSVYPAGAPELGRPGLQGKTGVYSFRGLPGLGGLEMGQGDDPYWLANEGRVAFTLEVSDPAGRYLPWQWNVRLPHRGLLSLAASPAGLQLAPDATWLPVFSAAARPFDAAIGVVRAQLVDATLAVSPPAQPAPAAWAMVEARAGTAAPVFGLADARGVVAVPIPYPPPPSVGLGSPLSGGSVPLGQQTWPVQIRVYYGAIAAGRLPDLVQILNQPAAFAWQDQALRNELTGSLLRFGRDLILRTQNSATLFITVAGSPPH